MNCFVLELATLNIGSEQMLWHASFLTKIRKQKTLRANGIDWKPTPTIMACSNACCSPHYDIRWMLRVVPGTLGRWITVLLASIANPNWKGAEIVQNGFFDHKPSLYQLGDGNWSSVVPLVHQFLSAKKEGNPHDSQTWASDWTRKGNSKPTRGRNL